jgi:hypothetical protein
MKIMAGFMVLLIIRCGNVGGCGFRECPDEAGN